MNSKPIIFGGDSVRAILAGIKTQTRRVVKPQPASPDLGYMMMQNGNALLNGPDYPDGDSDEVKAPYKTGHRLWVRETWSPDHKAFYPNFPVVYKADPASVEPENGSTYSPEAKRSYPFRWRSPIHMPLMASRLSVLVETVRVERLHDITEVDARDEGGPPSHPSIDMISQAYGFTDFPRSWFAQHWDAINGKNHPWNSNPWVWVITFSKL